MSSQNDSDEVPVNIITKDAPAEPVPCDADSDDMEEPVSQTEPKDDVSEQLVAANKRALDYEEKLKHAMADFQNLERKTRSDIENGVNAKVDGFMLDFLSIYDDFVLARQAFYEGKVNTDGLDSILRNMDSLFKKHHISQIDALGKPFDPNFHEAISIVSDPEIEENIITKEIRKGYISHERVIRPTLVEISKKG
ncbi:MAG: nucleotide exchange factor GrpE [Nitrosopumilus sp. B06]|nr:MAG: nucleotide exchange factor GrpE [Nitrosopumilus sp. D6]RNJ80293.1 MAG: nucleotide exchange factor GrpE [Nitrosopumilus sp. B06]